nr:erythrocyte membrane protein 1, PfEMP1, putative [Plasmodium sp. DRC-Itaito]
MPTLKSSNRYVPYSSAKHRGKRYIYIEGDSGTDSGYTDHYSDITYSSESEYEDIDMHIPRVPKYKTLIEVVLEPSKRDIQNDMPSDDIPRNEPMNDDVWNQLKDDFISNMLSSTQNDMPNNLPDNSDNNTHPNTLYDNMVEKPFIMSIHDRNLYTGEEYNYDMLNSGIDPKSFDNVSYSGTNDPISGNPSSYSDNHNPISDNPSSYSGNVGPYSGIDLINDALSVTHDIYDEILKRKENELFGTENPKHTTPNRFGQPAREDPLHNQIQLFHKWLDRHRDMCEKWENNHERLNKLKEQWEKDYTSGNDIPSDNIPSGNLSDIPSGNLSDTSTGKLSDIPSGKLSDTSIDNNKHSDIPYVLNTDVSIQIEMDTNQVENTNPNHVENNIYMDNNTPNPHHQNHNPNTTLPYNPNLVENINLVKNNINPPDTPTKVKIEMSVKNSTMAKENFPIGDVWGI